MSDPPSLLRRVLSAALPRDIRDTALADLDEEYCRFMRPGLGRWRAVLWYSRQVAGSLLPALSMRRRRAEFAARARVDGIAVPERRPRPWVHDVLQDLHHTARALRVRKGFAVATVVVMALGIGATTTVFSIVDGILLRPLPYPEPDRLIRIWSLNPRGIPRNSVSPPDFFDMRDGLDGTGPLAAFTEGETFALTGIGEPTANRGHDGHGGFFRCAGSAGMAGAALPS